MSNQEKYDELDTLIKNIDNAIEEADSKYLNDYIEQLKIMKYELQNDLSDIEKKVQEEQDREERQQEREYWEAVIWANIAK